MGKTGLLFRLKHGTFSGWNQSTIGCEFFSHTIMVPPREGVPPVAVKLLLWDTAGQEEFRAFTPNFLRGAAACLVCYDVTSPASFRHAAGWLRDAREACAGPVLVALVGTKADLASSRAVTREEAEEYAQSVGALTARETSAKTGEGVAALFDAVGRGLLRQGPVGHADADARATVRLCAPPAEAAGLCPC